MRIRMDKKYICQICGKEMAVKDIEVDSCGYVQCSYDECPALPECDGCQYENTCGIKKGEPPTMGE